MTGITEEKLVRIIRIHQFFVRKSLVFVTILFMGYETTTHY